MTLVVVAASTNPCIGREFILSFVQFHNFVCKALLVKEVLALHALKASLLPDETSFTSENKTKIKCLPNK
jgi:hypothetical protein